MFALSMSSESRISASSDKASKTQVCNNERILVLLPLDADQRMEALKHYFGISIKLYSTYIYKAIVIWLTCHQRTQFVHQWLSRQLYISSTIAEFTFHSTLVPVTCVSFLRHFRNIHLRQESPLP
jgi:hypothetical protein